MSRGVGRASPPRDRLEGPATADSRANGWRWGWTGLPRLSPVLLPLVIQQPFELAFDPASQLGRVEPRPRAAALPPAWRTGTGSGARHPIHQLTSGLDPTVEPLLQPFVVPARHGCRLAATHPGPSLETESQQGDGHPCELQSPQKNVERAWCHEARLSAGSNISRQLACQRPPCNASQQGRQARPCTRRRYGRLMPQRGHLANQRGWLPPAAAPGRG